MQEREVRAPVGSEGDEFAVGNGAVAKQLLELAHVWEERGVVLAAAAAQAHTAGARVGEDAVAVPLHFEGELDAVFPVEGDVRLGGHGGQHGCKFEGRGFARCAGRAGLALHQLQHPVVLLHVGAHEGVAARDAA